MVQLKTRNSAQVQPQLNQFSDWGPTDRTQIIFSPNIPQPGPNRLPGVPQLQYLGPEGEFTFTGTEVEQQLSRLGTLVTITFQPNLDTEGLNFTLVLPPITTLEQQVEFRAIAIKTKSCGLVTDSVGTFFSYELIQLAGIARLQPSAMSCYCWQV